MLQIRAVELFMDFINESELSDEAKQAYNANVAFCAFVEGETEGLFDPDTLHLSAQAEIDMTSEGLGYSVQERDQLSRIAEDAVRSVTLVAQFRAHKNAGREQLIEQRHVSQDARKPIMPLPGRDVA